LVDRLASAVDLSVDELQSLARVAPKLYVFYDIPKKNGGTRTIAQPYRRVKAVQYAILEQELYDLPIHSSATAYTKGSSIKRNAGAHRKHPYLLKMDFSSFFHSIAPRHFREHIRYCSPKKYTRQELAVLWRFLFWARPTPHGEKKPWSLCLSIGAPSSPFISNSMLSRFDTLIAKECLKRSVVYTRYADDLTFSSSDLTDLKRIQRSVERTVGTDPYDYLEVNTKKTQLLTKKNRRTVTGLTLTNDLKVSMGREKKRLIRSMIHRYKLGHIRDKADLDVIRGNLAFAMDVEPEFVARLRRKYSDETILSLMTLDQS
jgi:RNA-directed DNA polymerase